jgi:hypothetical protein
MRRSLELDAEVFGHAPVAVRARVVDLDPPARVRRALRPALPLVGGALLSAAIPGWHFIGVPAFVVAALVLGLRRLRQARIVESVSGPCPACGEPVEWAVPGAVRFPDTFPCPRCREFVRLRER